MSAKWRATCSGMLQPMLSLQLASRVAQFRLAQPALSMQPAAQRMQPRQASTQSRKRTARKLCGFIQTRTPTTRKRRKNSRRSGKRTLPCYVASNS